MPGPINNTGGASAIGVPCIQNVPTPVGTIPTPSVNMMTSVTAIPNVINIIYGGMPVINQMTENPVSVGSIPTGGLVTAGLCQDSQNIGCSTVLNVGAMMSTSMADPTGHNKDFNSMGAYLVPSPPAKWMTGR